MSNQTRRIFLLIVVINVLLILWFFLPKSTRIVSVIPRVDGSSYKIILMDDRWPFYQLATTDGRKPDANGDRAQATVVKNLKLFDRCQSDPSLVVVDIGAFLGDFGLYAAACGCRVDIFEIQAEMVDLIQLSIKMNKFSTDRVRVFNKAVTNSPNGTFLSFSGEGGETSLSNGSSRVSTIRLDDFYSTNDSNIFLMKIDVEGFELSVFESAENLFRSKSVENLVFEFSAWLDDRQEQDRVLPFILDAFHLDEFYALHRTGPNIYGPIGRTEIDRFYQKHHDEHLQTDVFLSSIPLDTKRWNKMKNYDFSSSKA